MSGPGARRMLDGMTIQTTSSQVPVVPVLIAGIAAQLVDDAALLLLPPLGLLGPLSGLLAILLTVGAARYVSRDRSGAAIARTGLAVGLASAAVGLLIGGLGIVALLLAVVTVGVGVAGAVAGRAVRSAQR